MATKQNDASEGASDIHEQLALLRAQLDKLAAEHAPDLASITARAEEAARRGVALARENAAVVSDRVKEQPLAALLVAGVAGFIAGRLLR